MSGASLPTMRGDDTIYGGEAAAASDAFPSLLPHLP
jgi:hypothetical protein